MEEKKYMAKKAKKTLKGSKKKQRAIPAASSDSQESKWQEFLRRHSNAAKEKK